MFKNKKGQLVTGLIGGIVGLIILVVVSFVILETLTSSNLITSANGVNATNGLIGNYTAGIANVASKIPTILLIAAVVLLFGAIVFLVARARQTTMGASGGGAL